MTARPVTRRHWRSYGDDPLPAPAEALNEPFSAFPSWFMRITCDRCGKVQMVNESHAGRAELLTGIDGVSSRPMRKILLRAE